MDSNAVRRAVCRAIAESTELSEEEVWALPDSAEPIKGIEGFDSYSGEEATAAIGDFLEVDIPLQVNLFVASDGPRRALRIGEIVSRISKLRKVTTSKA